MRGLSNSSYLLFERKTNHVSTSIQITGGLKGPHQPLVTSHSFAQIKVRLAKIWWPLAARNVTGVYISKKENMTSRWWFQFFLCFHPDPWGKDPIWRAYFSGGLVQPPTRHGLWKTSQSPGWLWYFYQPPKTYRNPNTKHLRYGMTGGPPESRFCQKKNAIGWVFIKRDEELLSYIRDYNEPW